MAQFATDYSPLRRLRYACLMHPTTVFERGLPMILLTDPNKPSHEGFSYAMPQGREAWQVWRAAAARCNSYVMGIAMAYRLDDSGKKDLILILPDESHSDDDIETAAAHLRVMEKFEGGIFVMRPEPERPKRDVLLAALAGAEIEEMGAPMDMGDGT